MKFFRKRSVALVLCALVVLVSTLVNTRWKLGNDCEKLKEAFYGANSLASQLESLLPEEETLAGVAERNGLDIGGMRESAGMLRQLLRDHSYDAASIYQVYDALRYELRAVEQELLSSGLSAEDASAVSRSLEKVHTLQASIASADFNEQVRSFRSRNGSLFTRVLASLVGVRLPEVFA